MSTKTVGLKSDTRKTRNEVYMKQLAQEYEATRDVKAIAERENINSATLYYHFRKMGISHLSGRTHELDETYFEKIDSDEKAYIVGFIMADGCIAKSCANNKRPNRIQINISQKDRDVLEFIREELKCDYGIKDYLPPESTYGNAPMSMLVINSTKLCNDLAMLGISQDKTGREQIPELIPDKYKGAFLRGFFDGDGCAYINSNKKRISFTSASTLILQQIKELVQRLCGVKGSPQISKGGKRADGTDKHAWIIVFGRQSDVYKIRDFMYKNASYFFERKRLRLT